MCREYDKLIIDILNIGVKKGDVLLVHSSFKALKTKTLTPSLIIDAFLEVLGEEGTLIMPALSYDKVNKDNPYFSYHDTKACTGIISETFRNKPGVRRSLNPIHSFSVYGKLRDELTSKHQNDSKTLWYNSPIYLMLTYQPKLLMLGCKLLPNTFMHLVENLAYLPYRETKYVVNFAIIDQDNLKTFKEIELPNMKNYIQRYDRVKEILNEDELINKSILSAESYLINLNALYDKALKKLKQEPFFFVDEIK